MRTEQRRVPENARNPPGQFLKMLIMESKSLIKYNEICLLVPFSICGIGLYWMLLDAIGWYAMVLDGIGWYWMVSNGLGIRRPPFRGCHQAARLRC